MPSQPLSDMFVAPEKEMQRLRSILEQTMAGEGRVVMIAGEPGIGKTRIAREFTQYAESRNVETLWGRCYEGEGAPLYWPWVQVIRKHLSSGDPDEFRSRITPGVTAIAEIIPETADILNTSPACSELPSSSAQFQLFYAVTTFLKNCTLNRHVIVVLEDLHWSDGPSLKLLEFLAHEISDSKLLVIGTYRDVEVRTNHPLSRTLGDLTRERLFEKITLRGIGLEGVRELLAGVAGSTVSTELIDEVHTYTQRNPLFVGEVAKLLLEEGAVAAGDSPAIASRRFHVPVGIKDAIGRRLGRLGERCNRVLRCGALQGHEFSISVMGRLIDHASSDEILELLEGAVEAGIVAEIPASFGRYRFCYKLVQEVLVEELSIASQSRLHAKIAEILEDQYGENAGDHATALVEHLSKAESLVGTRKLVE